MLGHAGGVAAAGWPVFDPGVARAEEIVVPVQVNGKVRARLTVPLGMAEAALQEMALADPLVRTHTDGRTIRKVVVAHGKLVSIVAS